MSAGIVHTGDWGVPLTLTFTDRSGAAVSLAGATVTLGLISPTGTRVDRTATVSGDGTAGGGGLHDDNERFHHGGAVVVPGGSDVEQCQTPERPWGDHRDREHAVNDTARRRGRAARLCVTGP